jgi:hypothetical protein
MEPARRDGTARAVHDDDRPGRAVEPIERLSEVLAELIVVLTFTGSLSAAESGRAERWSTLVGAPG